MIYFARATGLELVKIGHTDAADAAARLSTLQTGCPVDLTLAATMPGDQAVERELHAYFAHLRVKGEWFREAADLTTLITGLAARKGRVLPEDDNDDCGEWFTRWFSPQRPPEWRIAGVAEAAFRRGFQHGALPLEQTLPRCRSLTEAIAVARGLNEITAALRRDGAAHPSYLATVLAKLYARFPHLKPDGYQE